MSLNFISSPFPSLSPISPLSPFVTSSTTTFTPILPRFSTLPTFQVSLPSPFFQSHKRQQYLFDTTAPYLKSPTMSTASNDHQVQIKKGDIAVRALPYGKYEIVEIVDFDSAGKTADIEVLSQFNANLYIRSDSSATTYERLSKLYPILSTYVPDQNGFRVDGASLASVLELINTSTSSVVANAAAASEKTSRSQQLDQFPLPFPMPSKKQALVGAAASVPMAALIFAAYLSLKQTFTENPVDVEGNARQVSTLFRQVLVGGLYAASTLTLVIGAALLLYALTSKEESK